MSVKIDNDQTLRVSVNNTKRKQKRERTAAASVTELGEYEQIVTRPKSPKTVDLSRSSGQVVTDMSASGILPTLVFLLLATTLEVTGDAVVRLSIYQYAGFQRFALMLMLGAPLLLGYGVSLNLAPVEFRHVVGLYIATLFIVWQFINFAFFRTLPNLPILVGGTLIVVGGLIVTFWRTKSLLE